MSSAEEIRKFAKKYKFWIIPVVVLLLILSTLLFLAEGAFGPAPMIYYKVF